MGQKTYASYKDKIYNWVDLLDELGLSHNNGQSAHIEFDKYAIHNKKLQSAKVMIKNEDDEFVEAVKNEYGEYVEKDKSIKTSNGRKRPTNAQLPNGEVISWVSLLERYNLKHNKRRSAHDEWDEYFEYKKGLPNIKEVPKNSEVIYKNGNNEIDTDKSPIRPPMTKDRKDATWFKYVGGNIPEAKCYCCNVRPIHITDFEVGHNIPFSKGGTESIENLRPICRQCNKGMGNRLSIEEYKKEYYE
jgi:5-methylcytosine-specific restriction endonuclease McrA